jgi:HEPN domain-containing protein
MFFMAKLTVINRKELPLRRKFIKRQRHMMTKEDHIAYWVKGAKYDWTGTEHAFDTKDYVHCLFWAHLTLEKLAKAHWVKNHIENIPPRVHNVVWLLEESNVDLGVDIMDFLRKFNTFQLSTRYSDYMDDMYQICTKDLTTEKLEKVKEVRTCLLKML